MTTAGALAGADGANDATEAAVVGAAELLATAEGDAPLGVQAARNAAAADIVPPYRKPRRLSGVWAILRMTCSIS